VRTAEELKQDIIYRTTLRGQELLFHSTWGLFSPRSVDNGSYLLIKHVEIEPGQQTLDLGCGYGVIGLSIAKANPTGVVHMVDKDFAAIEFAKKNAVINRITNSEIYLSNGFSSVENVMFDNIVSNLPAKVGKELLYIFLSDARRHLRPDGQIVVVTISGLREFIKRNFMEVFGNYKKVKQGKTHTVARAVNED